MLATRVLPASPNFGQAKHGQNGPAATVCQQGICFPICEHHFTHWTHPDISLPFRAGGRRVKHFRFTDQKITYEKVPKKFGRALPPSSFARNPNEQQLFLVRPSLIAQNCLMILCLGPAGKDWWEVLRNLLIYWLVRSCGRV